MKLGLAFLAVCVYLGAQTVPKFKYDPDWPKPLPNKWKLGGVTGVAVDKDDNVWVLNRPNDLTDIELEAELTPPLARYPSDRWDDSIPRRCRLCRQLTRSRRPASIY